MMGTISFGLGLLCAAMMALMCLPMAVGMIRSRRRQHTDTPATPAAGPAARQASPAGPSTADG